MMRGKKGLVELDVAIIGAGVSGLYTGWRLKTDSKTQNLKTAIFEMSARVGGRLYTIRMHGVENVPVELGGMRFMAHQKLVEKVIETFNLEVKTFPMGKPETNLFYLRGKRFTEADWEKNKFKHPFNVKIANKGKTPDELFQTLVDNVLAGPKNKDILRGEKLKHHPGRTFTRKQWDKIKSKLVYEGGPDHGNRLENIGFWNLIRNEISSEGYELLAQAGGYYSNTLNWNAAEALPYVVGDFAGPVQYKTLTEGFDQIARKLYGGYHNTDPNTPYHKVHTQTKLQKIETNTRNRRRYQLTLLDGTSNENFQVYADKIVLAMPRRSLELIAGGIQVGSQDQWETLQKGFRDNIRCVIGEPSFKLLMAFDTPWWKKVKVPRTSKKIENGRAITDMAMRQCYYFGTQKDPGTGNENGVMLASYNDMRTVAFWKPLENIGNPSEGNQFFKLFEPAYRRQNPSEDPKDYEQAPQRMVHHALDQLGDLHNFQVPTPIDTAYFNWNDDPYGGGYHAWKANYNVASMMRKMRHNPVGSEAIYVCGEAYSDQQGWVEGALCIAEKILIDNFGTTALVPGYYLGR
ncbi:FAD-dependent oxidoreductase [Nitrospiraceae bacterium AH_259_D15_M11_P09]|nr:FAD-dependent oxidoreductase [Nitrospiraceae bacterium AH_259_D15_M11_P09]